MNQEEQYLYWKRGLSKLSPKNGGKFKTCWMMVWHHMLTCNLTLASSTLIAFLFLEESECTWKGKETLWYEENWMKYKSTMKFHLDRRKILKAICLVFWNYLFTVGKRRIYFGGYFVQTPNFTHLTIHKKSINLLELTLPNPFVVPPSHTSTSMWCVHNIVCTNASTAIRKMWSISRGNRKPSLNNTWVKWRFPLLGYYSRKLL